MKEKSQSIKNVTKSIYDLELHESCEMNQGLLFVECTRVHGGWIYLHYDRDSLLTSTFVPYTQIPNAPMTEKEVVDFMEENKELMDDLSK